tara:strand:+ start:722 stop:1882 length:1161 start_codon:yes stop_codon:yes gene_type:complete
MNIPFHKPILPDDIGTLFPDSIHNGWLTTGPQVNKFESQISEYLNIENVVAVNSCTAALHLALASKSFDKEDHFIAPTHTFISTVEAGEYLGMRPVLIDSQENGFNLDLNRVEDALKINKNIKAIIPVHFAGELNNMNDIFLLASRYNLFVLEDSAHAFELSSQINTDNYNNHAIAFSFYANKNITTGGEGGAIATRDKKLANKVRQLSLHGMSKDGWKRYQKSGKWAYDISDKGYKYNMTDVSACFGIWQLQFVDKWYKRRLEIVNQYDSKLKIINGLICPIINKGNHHAWHLYIIQIKTKLWEIDRNSLISELNKYGVGTSVHYIPVHMHSYYREKYGYKKTDYPNSHKLYETVISLPLYPKLKNDEVSYIIDVIYELWEKYKA